MRRWIYFLCAVLLAACAQSPAEKQPEKADYADLGPAPELSGEVWLNSAGPLRLAGLRGKVVLIDMWTFG